MKKILIFLLVILLVGCDVKDGCTDSNYCYVGPGVNEEPPLESLYRKVNVLYIKHISIDESVINKTYTLMKSNRECYEILGSRDIEVGNYVIRDNSECDEEYKIKYEDGLYFVKDALNKGYISVKELNRLGYPFEIVEYMPYINYEYVKGLRQYISNEDGTEELVLDISVYKAHLSGPCLEKFIELIKGKYAYSIISECYISYAIEYNDILYKDLDLVNLIIEDVIPAKRVIELGIPLRVRELSPDELEMINN